MADIKKPIAQQNYDTIMADLRAKKYKPVYILMGTKSGSEVHIESYFIDEISEFVLNNVLSEEERDFNQTLAYGADTSMQAIVEQAKRYPIMAERQVVVLREAQACRDFDVLEKYLEKPNPTTILLICYNGAIDMRKKLMTLTMKVGDVGVFAPLRDYELGPFIEAKVREKGIAIDPKAKAMLAEHVGSDLKRIISELEKMSAVFPPGAPKKISAEIVEKCVGISKEFNVFELRDAFATRNVEKANLIVKHIMSNPRSGGLFKILPGLFSFFQNLMLAFYAPARNASAIMSYLGLPNEYSAKIYLEAINRYKPIKVLQIIDKFREIDAKSKGLDATGNTTPEELAKELVFFILH